MADPRDQKGAHAREFTNHELLTLRIWFDLDLANNDDLAQRLLDAGLMLEHYTSLLDNDPGKCTIDELQNQVQLTFAFQQVLNEANQFLLTHDRFGNQIRQGFVIGAISYAERYRADLLAEVNRRGGV